MVDGGTARDASRAWLRALERSAAARQRPEATLPVLVAEQAQARPDAPALLSEGASLTYAELAARVRLYGDWARAQDVRPGDVVALLMANCPDYVAIWLGITGVGGVVALLNTNLAEGALAHCARAAAPRHVIAGHAHVAGLAALAVALGPDVVCWLHGADDPRFPRSDGPLGEARETAEPPRPTISDLALLIYTSGTTGLPKAARVTHGRIVAWSHWFAGMADVQPWDRMYNCLPMYHSVGGVVAVGALLVSGGAVVVRERFSVSRFWDEVCDWDCTLFQYIGEICRYLANAPPNPRERAHRLRLCVGNGLRGDVWARFQTRFAIPEILEFYASTEGTVSLYNCEGQPGAIGRVPGFLAHRFPIALVRCDPETFEPMRNAAGRCIACPPDEPGEALGRIASPGAFEGYTDEDASARKVMRDVFAQGDAWFRTGDLMRRDRAGFFYFVDRLGDTFRWKGENVSTAEVADVIAACPGVIDAVVFGVAVPGADGRAGMAAIATDDSFDLTVLHTHLAERLPEYARPLFLRLCASIDTTGTFKLAKSRLQAEGFAPNEAGEPLYFADRAQGGYVELDRAWLGRLEAGMRL